MMVVVEQTSSQGRLVMQSRGGHYLYRTQLAKTIVLTNNHAHGRQVTGMQLDGALISGEGVSGRPELHIGGHTAPSQYSVHCG